MKGGKKGRERQPGKGGPKPKAPKAGGPGTAKDAKASRKVTQPRKRGESVKSYGWSSSSDEQ
ncbi:hypothetical protein LBMAG44_01030 [Gemmatimonadota bacterium]|nr:hypothetical protein LBMAG44_01030 [Gemmatimonadota bacterium]